MLLESEQASPLKLKNDDRVKLDMYHTADEYCVVEGNVSHWWGYVLRLPGLASDERTLVIRRRGDTHSGQRILDTYSGLSKIDKLSDARTKLALLRKAEIRIVDIQFDNNHSYNRKRSILAAAFKIIRQEIPQSAMIDLLTCNRFDRLPHRDMLVDWAAERIAALKQCLSATQAKALEAVRYMPGGIAIINGCPDAGKSFWLVELLTHYALHLADVDSGKRQALRALVVSPINANADSLAESFNKRFSSAGLCDAIVIRKFSRDGENAQLEHGKREKQMHRIHDLNEPGLSECQLSQVVLNDFVAREARDILEDKRIRKDHLCTTLAEWVRWTLDPDRTSPAIARIREALGPKSMAAFEKHLSACSLSADKRSKTLDMVAGHCEKVAQAVLTTADVVVCTIQLAADEAISEHFTPRIVAVDEAAKAQSIEGLVWLLFSGCEFRILLGDPTQSRAHILTPASAAFNAGADKFLLFLSTIGPGNLEYPVIVVDAGETTQLPEGTSRHNPGTALVVRKLVQQLMVHGYTDRELGIIFPYLSRGQHHANRKDDVMIATCEGSQGQSRDVIIFDVSNTKSFGFVGEGPRLNTALSRARFGIILVVSLSSTHGEYLGKFGDILDWCKARNSLTSDFRL